MESLFLFNTAPDTDYNTKRQNVKIIRASVGRIFENSIKDSKIIIVMQGSFRITYDKFIDKKVEQGEMILIPPRSPFKAIADEDIILIQLHLDIRDQFRGALSLTWLNEIKNKIKYDFFPLKVTGKFSGYIESLKIYMDDGLKSNGFYRYKIKEFLYLMKFYYSKQELAMFFYPLINKDTEFSDFVFENYHKYKTVQDLAEASCRSLSVFNKMFRKSFGTSPYHWMKIQKAKKIYYDIVQTEKTLKQISNENGFNSLPQFTHFCQTNFGHAARKIREISRKKAAQEQDNNKPE